MRALKFECLRYQTESCLTFLPQKSAPGSVPSDVVSEGSQNGDISALRFKSIQNGSVSSGRASSNSPLEISKQYHTISPSRMVYFFINNYYLAPRSAVQPEFDRT